MVSTRETQEPIVILSTGDASTAETQSPMGAVDNGDASYLKRKDALCPLATIGDGIDKKKEQMSGERIAHGTNVETQKEGLGEASVAGARPAAISQKESADTVMLLFVISACKI